MRNKWTTELQRAFKTVFRKRGGARGLAEFADKYPVEFYKLIGRQLPLDVKIDVGPIRLVFPDLELTGARVAEIAGRRVSEILEAEVLPLALAERCESSEAQESKADEIVPPAQS